MKKCYLKLTAVLFAALTIGFTSCSEDDDDKANPTITQPSELAVQIENSVDVTFAYTAEAGFASSAVVATGGTATVTTDGTADAESGNIVVAFTAGSTAGAGSVTLTVTDNDGNFALSTAVISISEEPVILPKERTIMANISGTETWYEDTVYTLGTRVTILDGGTLNIEAGTVIKGAAGTGENATALLVAKGGTLNANGTAAKPIIMTTIADDIITGSIVSPNDMDPSFNGAWGGLIVLGDASISADAAEVQIEGIPSSDENGLYGGSDDDDNSGTITYVSIRHGGSNIGEGNEINGITLGGVGTGTTINHIEVVANQDDGIECFGGTVDVGSVLVWNSGDDAFDMDQDYQGTIDNFIGIMGDETDHAMELDGPEGASDEGGYTLINGSLKGWNDEGEDGGEFADLRSGMKGTISDCYFFNFSMGADFELDNDGVAANYEAGDITISGLEFNFYLEDDDEVVVQENADVDLTDVFLDKGDNASDAFATAGATPSDIASKVTTPTVGATKSEFTGWTWADAAGELADF